MCVVLCASSYHTECWMRQIYTPPNIYTPPISFIDTHAVKIQHFSKFCFFSYCTTFVQIYMFHKINRSRNFLVKGAGNSNQMEFLIDYSHIMEFSAIKKFGGIEEKFHRLWYTPCILYTLTSSNSHSCTQNYNDSTPTALRYVESVWYDDLVISDRIHPLKHLVFEQYIEFLSDLTSATWYVIIHV